MISSIAYSNITQPPYVAESSHINLGNLVLLIFEASMEVVCVSLPGYILARQGIFSAEHQRFLANLNVMLFTPCLSELSAKGLSSGAF